MDSLFSSSFMPHGHCFLWIRELVLLHAGSDILIAIAYFSIPFALLYIARKRPDIEFRPMFMLFAAFILACGVTHVLGAWNLWQADYWLSGGAKLVTAVVSVTTAVVLWRRLPEIVDMPSRAQLREANEELRKEVRRREQMDISLRESEKQLRGAFDQAPIGKALVALNGHWIKVNPALCGIVGYTERELLDTDFQSITHPDDLDADLALVEELLAGRRRGYQMEKRYLHKAGHLVWVLLSVTLVRDDDGTPRYFISQILDITYRKLAEEEMRHARAELEARVAERTRELDEANRRLQDVNRQLEIQSCTDSLSQVFNRRYFNEHIVRLFGESRRYHVDLSVMLIDIDNFKSINDTYGHLAGDDVIRRIAAILQGNLRGSDIIARFGGDEFCVAVPHTSARNAEKIAAKILESIRGETIDASDGRTFSVTCSIGVVELRDGIDNVQQLLSVADRALYAAKQQGRDQIKTMLTGS